MKNCDSCINFVKIRSWQMDHRKGLCDYTDWSIVNMKGKPCEYYISKKYKRRKIK